MPMRLLVSGVPLGECQRCRAHYDAFLALSIAVPVLVVVVAAAAAALPLPLLWLRPR